MANILNSDNTKCWWRCREIVLLLHFCEWVQPLRKTVAVSHEPKHATIVNNCTLGHLSQRNENLRSCNNLNMNIHSGFIYNSQKLNQFRCPSTGKWLNRLWSTRTVESCSAIKEQTTDTRDNQGDSPGDYAEWKKANHRRLHTAWFHSHTLLKWQNDKIGEQPSDCLGPGMEREVGVAVKG